MAVDVSVLEAINARLRSEVQRLTAENTELKGAVAHLQALEVKCAELAAENVRLQKELLQAQKCVADWMAENARLQRELSQSLKDVAELNKENAKREKELSQALKRVAELERKSARQAAPFRRRKTEEEKKRPGRKEGHRGSRRPVPDHVDHDIDVPLDECPHCHCPVDNKRWRTQYIAEIPPILPEITRLTTCQATCPICGEVCSTHPLQVSQAQGAAGVHLGPRAIAWATLLKMHFGLPMRKVCDLLNQGFGLSFSAGGLSQLLKRVADKTAPKYEELKAQIQASSVVYADETSWYVGQPDYWLWVVTTADCLTLYHVDESRGQGVVKQLLGDFSGVLVTDCGTMYNAFECSKHKCIAHHLHRLGEMRKQPDTTDPTYLNAWAELWKDVLGLTKARDDLPGEEFDRRHAALKVRIEALIEQEVTQTGDRKFQTRMRNSQKSLLGCLEHAGVEPTNNRAERAIRPAVIARKISCGNRTPRGALTWQILASQCATLCQQGRDLLSHFASLVVLSRPLLAG